MRAITSEKKEQKSFRHNIGKEKSNYHIISTDIQSTERVFKHLNLYDTCLVRKPRLKVIKLVVKQR